MTNFDAALEGVLKRTIDDFVRLKACRRLSGGASQETYAIVIETTSGERKLALRRAPGGQFKRNAHGGPGLAVEAQLIKSAADAGVPEPKILCTLGDGDGLGPGFLMSWVDGETLGSRIARHDDFAKIRPSLSRQCGEILAHIHAIDLATTGLDKVLQRMDPEAFIRSQWRQYQAFGTPQPMIDYTARWLLDNLPPAGPLTLVHNDFRNGNLIVDEHRGVVAVLDWEVAHVGDPMRDLGWICTNSWRFGVGEREVGGFGELSDLIAGYEAVSRRPVERSAVHFWKVFGSFWWAIGCLAMAEHYRSGPDRSVERPAIGRRSSECQVDCVNLLIPGPVTLPTATVDHDNNMPLTAELLASVRNFLNDDVTKETSGRTRFLARVAANSIGIIERERSLGATQAAAEAQRLRKLLNSTGALHALRWQLVERIADGSMALADAELTTHLRETVVARVAIDQPTYSGYKLATQST